MRITVLANRDLASNFALNLLLDDLKEHESGIFLSDRVGKASTERPQELVDLKFLEQDLINELLFPLIESSAAPHDGERYLTFRQLGDVLAYPTESLNNVNAPEGLARLRDRRPDVILSIRYGKILKDDAIAVPRLGVINLHSGLLPAYRGVLAAFRGLLNGDSEIGCTLHFIDNAKIDAGPILGRRTIPVEPAKSLLAHVLALYPVGCEMIRDVVTRLARGEELITEAQDPTQGEYFTYPTSEDFERFRQAGFKIFDGSEMKDFLGRYFISKV